MSKKPKVASFFKWENGYEFYRLVEGTDRMFRGGGKIAFLLTGQKARRAVRVKHRRYEKRKQNLNEAKVRAMTLGDVEN